MPIYAYRCAACGHAKDVLRKLSDPPLADCPACGEPQFEKQVTSAGFQLKGSGWYATDFKNPPKAPPAAPVAAKDGETKPAADAAAATPAAPAGAAASAPAPASAAASTGSAAASSSTTTP